jgi:N6-adenosine-specific RNA methylase IME4
MRTNKRRNLTSSQWAAIAVEADELIEILKEAINAAYIEKQKQNAINSRKGGYVNKMTQPANTPNRLQQKLADTFNTNRNYINEAQKLKITSPEKFEQVKTGEKTLTEIKSEEKKEKIRQQRVDMAKTLKDMPLPEKKYQIIYADPPWKYDFSETQSRDIENHYPTMDTDDICNLNIPSADDSVLYLWATAPKLREALRVIDAWGFTYKTHAIWDKEKIGMGYWFRGQHELLLVATKGNFQPPQPEDRVPSVFRDERKLHSQKPPVVYEIIEKAYPELIKIELFCRDPRDGWDSWGNQI